MTGTSVFEPLGVVMYRALVDGVGEPEALGDGAGAAGGGHALEVLAVEAGGADGGDERGHLEAGVGGDRGRSHQQRLGEEAVEEAARVQGSGPRVVQTAGGER